MCNTLILMDTQLCSRVFSLSFTSLHLLITCSSSPAMPWCFPAGSWAQRIGRPSSPCAASWKRPWRICRTTRTRTRSCTSTWTSPQWNSGQSVAVTPWGDPPLCAWRAWTLWPPWKSTNQTATSCVPSTRPAEPSLTPWRASTCWCRPLRPRCPCSRPATPPQTPPRPLPPLRPWRCWRRGRAPEKRPGSDCFALKTMTRLITAKTCHYFTPVQEQDPASRWWLSATSCGPQLIFLHIHKPIHTQPRHSERDG